MMMPIYSNFFIFGGLSASTWSFFLHLLLDFPLEFVLYREMIPHSCLMY